MTVNNTPKSECGKLDNGFTLIEMLVDKTCSINNLCEIL
jgi:hypothetical protein